MRFDIYRALTEGLEGYDNKNLEGKFLKMIIPSYLARNVKEITPGYAEFKNPQGEYEVEILSQSTSETVNFKNVISFYTTTEDNRFLSSEEIIGTNKETEALYYSNIEIIENNDLVTVITGTVVYNDKQKEYITPSEIKVGAWIYDKKFIKLKEQLKDYLSSCLTSADAFGRLQEINTEIKKDSYLIPEDYATITITGNDKVEINNDGDVLDHQTCEDWYKSHFTDAQEDFEDPRALLKRCNILELLYLINCESKMCAKFNAIDFIRTIKELDEEKEIQSEKASHTEKEKQYKKEKSKK